MTFDFKDFEWKILVSQFIYLYVFEPISGLDIECTCTVNWTSLSNIWIIYPKCCECFRYAFDIVLNFFFLSYDPINK